MTPAARLHCASRHVAAVRRMIEEDAPCSEVLLQLRAVRGALQAVARILVAEEVRRLLHEEGMSGTARLAEELGAVMLRSTVLKRGNAGLRWGSEQFHRRAPRRVRVYAEP